MTASGNAQTSTTVVVVAIFLVILAVLNICAGIAVVTGGALLGAGANAILSSSGSTNSSVAAAQQVAGAATGGLILIGLLSLGLGFGALIDAVGLFLRKPWSYMGTLIVAGIYIALQLIGILLGSGIQVSSVIFIVLCGAIIFFFITDAQVKRALGQAA